MMLYNHIAPRFSDLESKMVCHIPQGGNWKNIPKELPSQRLAQIRESGGRTTYYGRLRVDRPSYTISTYFNRIGNGCFIHPTQDRLISIREGARLQSFRDSFIFYGSRTSQYKQIGNAVPPLLARAVAETVKKNCRCKKFIDLFSGAGGMSEGFAMEGFSLSGAIEIEKNFFETFLKNHYVKNHNSRLVLGDITNVKNKEEIIGISEEKRIGVVMGGPPCQGFSTAGWRDPSDKRNVLFKDFVACVDGISPEVFIMENVPGILSMEGGRAIERIVKSFEEIGYTVSSPIKLTSEEFGVPQVRKRVFVIGSSKKKKIAAPKPLFSYDNASLPCPITVGEAIGSLPALLPGSGELESEYFPKNVSEYEKFLIGRKSFKDFYSSVRKHP